MLTIGIVGTRGIPNNYGGFERFVELLVADSFWVHHKIYFNVYGEAENRIINSWTSLRKVGLIKSKSPFGYYFRSTQMAVEECDIILSCGVGISLGSFLPLLKNKPLIVNPDGCEWRRSKWNFFGRFLIRLMYWPALFCAKKIVIDAEALRYDFGPLFSKKYTYIGYQSPAPHLGVITTEQMEALDLRNKYFLVIARLEPENNVLPIIKAFIKLNRTDVDLIIVGGHGTDYYKNHLSALSSSNIRFIGAIYDQALLDGLRSKCVAYIHGHTVGGTNPSLLEALATVREPILCHKNKYNLEVAGINADYFASDFELSNLMYQAISRSSEGATYRRAPFIDERFIPKVISQKYLDLFKELDATR